MGKQAFFREKGQMQNFGHQLFFRQDLIGIVENFCLVWALHTVELCYNQ